MLPLDISSNNNLLLSIMFPTNCYIAYSECEQDVGQEADWWQD